MLEEHSFELYESGAPSTLIHLLNMKKSLEDYTDELMKEHSIRKREIATADPIMNKIHDFQRLLDDLESEIKDKSNGNKTKCFIESFYDKVNCTKGEAQENRDGFVVVAEKSRKKSKEHIDLLIRILKDKIGDLKSIKKHLRLNRLNNVAETGYDTDDEDGIKVNHLEENKEYNSTKMEENLSTSETDFNNSSVGGGSLVETSTVVITNEIKGRFFFLFSYIFELHICLFRNF